MSYRALWFLGVVLIAVKGVSADVADIDPSRTMKGNCSHAYEVCDSHAECIMLSKDSFYCKCFQNLPGDGLKNGTGCKAAHYTCVPKNVAKDCHPDAVCFNFTCKCKLGYEGNGKVCEDIDECLNKSICSPFAVCRDNKGSYTCTCKSGYMGDGLNCKYKCTADVDCAENGKCNMEEECVCRDGFEGDGITNCTDIDDCLEKTDNCNQKAKCINTFGSFKCVCNNGYAGNGIVCKELPKSCDDIYQKIPSARSNVYEIDTDGTGPLKSVQVQCLMENGIGITVFWPLKTSLLKSPITDKTVIEYDATLEQIKPLVENSQFCFQNVRFNCPSYFDLLEKVSWTDAKGQDQHSWGSVEKDNCACGVLGSCSGKNDCNCDGQNPYKKSDFGKLTTDIFNLPVKSLNFVNSKTSARYEVGPLKCGPRSFDLPKNCHEAKMKLGLKWNQPLLIDADGPMKPLKPFLILCDVTTLPHFGISVVPHDLKPGTIPTDSGLISLTYPATVDQISALIEGSVFCSQHVNYHCKNAPAGSVSAGKDAAPLKYFPGGSPEMPGSCACGLTGSCDVPAEQCNCDITDGVERQDIGMIIDKDALPVVSMDITVGGTKYVKVTVGELKCSEQQIGIEPNCEKLLGIGIKYSYTYMIDPDGVGGQPPFPAQCIMMISPPQGATVINHGNKDITDLTFVFLYKQATDAQIAGLKKRSSYCEQAVTLKCNKFAIHRKNDKYGFWVTQTGSKKYYFSGNGKKKNCDNADDMCECDKQAALGGFGKDDGAITNTDDLPIDSINFKEADDGTGSITYKIGPLMCYETFPTCADLFFTSKRNALKGESLVTSGQFTIDPDQYGGGEPFEVNCNFPMTTIDVTTPTDSMLQGGESHCFEIKYKDGAGNPLKRIQIEALVKASGSCNQYLAFACVNAPVTDKVYYSKCDGGDFTKIDGWAGSAGEEKCQCGVTGTCVGGTSYSCNCDLEDSEKYKDDAYITSKNLLPVCQVCITVDGFPPNGTGSIKSRAANFNVGKLFCSSNSMGTLDSCQDTSLLTNTKTGNVMLDADGKGRGEEAFPVYCDIIPYPQLGVMVIKPKESKITIPEDTFFIFNITYMIYRKSLIEKLMKNSIYCEQEISLSCVDSGLVLSDKFGWYNRDGKIMPFWSKGDTPCDGDGSNCQCNKPGEQEDHHLIVDQSAIPVTRVVLQAAKGKRQLYVGDVRCYDVYKDCYEIMKNNAKRQTNYIHNSTHVIDPDGPGGVKPFLVKCDFHDKYDYAITEIIYKSPPNTVKDAETPLEFKIPIIYPASSPKQSNALAKQSEFCYQGVLYECIQSPLTNNNDTLQSSIELYTGSTTSFGKGYFTESTGCPCSVVGTCNLDGSGSDDSTCRCDNKGSMMTYDNGTVVDKDRLPITSAAFGGQDSANSVGKFKLGPMRCANKPVDVPKDCEEALKWGYKSGEYLIFPEEYVEKPFFVFCDMDINPGHGVIRVFTKDKETIPVRGKIIDITYHGPTPEELKAIIKISKFCYQPVKYDCISTEFFGDRAVTWTGPSGKANKNFGSGAESSMECSCGADKLCGGYDGKTKMRARKCNCDIGDSEKRADAGVMTNKASLPLTKMTFSSFSKSAIANLTIGNLYCGTEEFDLNECEMGFHDCHHLADCRNTDGSYECICKKGYRGKIRGKTTEEVWSNGRQCTDDDECSFNACPSSAICANFPGTYNCTCKHGYIQRGFDVCEDINECLKPELNDCDENARCDNFEGGYSCACKRGFKDLGNGTVGDCEPQGLCACYGDPHCVSFDMKFFNFQGYCTYVMAQDGCTPGTSRTFQVLIKTWNQNRPGVSSVSWIKAFLLKVKNKEFEIRQSREILLNGALISGYNDNGIEITNTGQHIKVYLDTEVNITWNGHSEVEVMVPKNYLTKTCGLCGNFNFKKEDDWTVGPECKPEGSITTNPNKFGHSWVVPSSLNDSNNPMCYKACDEPLPKPECKMDILQARTICDAVFDQSRSPFSDCLKKMNQDIVAKLKSDCMFDVCEVPDDITIGQCAAANRLVEECKTIGERAPIWRNKPGIYCEMKCGEHMKYSICGGLNSTNEGPIITCHHHLMHEKPIPLESCIENCFCEDGFVLDGDKCIKKEECGCSENGTYMSAGQIKIAEDCSYLRKCMANGHIFSNTSLKCHANATCSVDMDTGIHGCHCKKGFMGDGVRNCREDPCADVKCTDFKTQKCVEGECKCIMGYTGDCQKCTDIDECATNTHNCVHTGQECVNRPGGFTCKCKPGFLPVGSYCADIDECDQNKKNPNYCPGNSECQNKPGGHDCVCCGGYRMGANGCVLDGTGDEKVGDVAKCCSCYGRGCQENGPVCGTDGKTYPSLKSLIIRSCKEGNNQVGLSHEGVCPATCDKLDCKAKHKFMKCKVHAKTGTASCECPSCKESKLESKMESVCASNNIKFESKCAFESFACQVGNTEITIVPKNASDCGPGPGSGEPVGKYGPWSNCSKCGVGIQRRSKEYLNIKDKDGKPFTIFEERVCYQTCPDSPCAEEVCPPPSVCVFDDLNITSCICPSCKGWGSDPICTLRRNILMTYDNDCERVRDACLLKEEIKIVQPVACGSKPLNCSKMMHWVSKKEIDGCFSQFHDFGECEGGCGSDPDDCCDEITEEQEVEYFCPDGTIKRKKKVVVDCKCISFEELIERKKAAGQQQT